MSCGVCPRCGSHPTLLWLWSRLELQLRFTPSLGNSICCGCGPKKTKKKTKKKKLRRKEKSDKLNTPPSSRGNSDDRIIVNIYGTPRVGLRHWAGSSACLFSCDSHTTLFYKRGNRDSKNLNHLLRHSEGPVSSLGL